MKYVVLQFPDDYDADVFVADIGNLDPDADIGGTYLVPQLDLVSVVAVYAAGGRLDDYYGSRGQTRTGT